MKKIHHPFHKKEREHSKKQNIIYGFICATVLIFVFCWWMRALTNAYYDSFVAYDDENAAEIIESNSRMQIDEEISTDLHPFQEEFDSWRNRHLADRCEVTSADGVVLHGLYYDCGYNRTVIVLPAYANNSTSDFFYAPWYEVQGWNVLLTDPRASGKSGGDYLSYGILERDDVTAWVQYASDKLLCNEIYLHGIGMGADAAVGAAGSGRLADFNVSGIIAESGYGSLRELAEYEMGNWFHLPTFPILNLVDNKMKRTVGYGIDDVDLTQEAAAAAIPAVFIAGGSDLYLPAEFSQNLYHAYGGEKQWIEISEADHGALYLLGHEKIEAAIASLIDSE